MSEMHRKRWEWAYILAALSNVGMLTPGKTGLVFGVGKEPLPSLLAKYGVSILATDAPIESDNRHGWSETNQHAAQVMDLWEPSVVPKETFEQYVAFGAADMRDIPQHLRGFDFLWSSCSLEHLGSLKAGADFILSAMDCLAPGGVAVHTTEFNLSSNVETVECDWISVYRKRDIEEIIARLHDAGHTVSPVNFNPGLSPVDEHIDVPPYGPTHIKLEFQSYTITSIGLIIRRAP